MQDLQAGTWREAFGKECAKDFSSALVGPDQRGHAEDKPLRAGIEIEPVPRIPHAVGQPVRQHVEHQARTRGIRVLGIASKAAKQRVAQGSEGQALGRGSLWAGVLVGAGPAVCAASIAVAVG